MKPLSHLTIRIKLNIITSMIIYNICVVNFIFIKRISINSLFNE